MSRPAVFLDRDGTIIEDVNYIAKSEDVRLLRGVGAAIQRLNEARIPVIVITNQSGIARGLISASDYERVRTRMDELLRAENARIDGTYMCPHHPDFTGACECRKPGTQLFRRAADDLGLDLERSWFVGDKLRDISPAKALGGRGILIAGRDTSASDVREAREVFSVARSLDEAVSRVIESAE